MADDNLVAAITGLSEGVRDILVPFYQGKIRKQQEIDFLTEQRALTAVTGAKAKQLTGINLEGVNDNDLLFPEHMALLNTRIAAQRKAQDLKAALNLELVKKQAELEIEQPFQIEKEERALTTTLAKEKRQEKVKQLATEKEARKVPAAQAGLKTLAEESIKGIENVKSILFPNGTPESFRRDIAIASNLPSINLPLIGRITPKVLPFSEKGQDVYRDMGAALAGRQLIQTGVAARPEETEALVSRFAAGMTSNPSASLRGLNKLQDFYRRYLENLTTKNLLGAGKVLLSVDGQEISGESLTDAQKKVVDELE